MLSIERLRPDLDVAVAARARAVPVLLERQGQNAGRSLYDLAPPRGVGNLHLCKHRRVERNSNLLWVSIDI
jgi:hypothetical protein